MAARITSTREDEETEALKLEDTKKIKCDHKFPLSKSEFIVAILVFTICSAALLCIYLTMPASQYTNIHLPRTVSHLRALKILVEEMELVVAISVFTVCSAGLLCIYLPVPASEYGNIHLPRTVFDLRGLNKSEFAVAIGVFTICSAGLICIYLTMPASQYANIHLPRTVSDLPGLKDHLETYAKAYPAQFILGYCSTYIFMQTFMIPGTIFMSLLAGALFGVIRGLFLVVFNASVGASSCYFLSKLIGRPIVTWLWPDKLKYFQAEIAKRKEKLLNYMLFLRITPTLPNLFINLASPIVDTPFHIFFLATVVGIVPASFITVKAGLALGELQSVKDLYDFKTLSVLFLIGFVSILPTVLKRKRVYE